MSGEGFWKFGRTRTGGGGGFKNRDFGGRSLQTAHNRFMSEFNETTGMTISNRGYRDWGAHSNSVFRLAIRFPKLSLSQSLDICIRYGYFFKPSTITLLDVSKLKPKASGVIDLDSPRQTLIPCP